MNLWTVAYRGINTNQMYVHLVASEDQAIDWVLDASPDMFTDFQVKKWEVSTLDWVPATYCWPETPAI